MPPGMKSGVVEVYKRYENYRRLYGFKPSISRRIAAAMPSSITRNKGLNGTSLEVLLVLAGISVTSPRKPFICIINNMCLLDQSIKKMENNITAGQPADEHL